MMNSQLAELYSGDLSVGDDFADDFDMVVKIEPLGE
jgi:hypothetical protein